MSSRLGRLFGRGRTTASDAPTIPDPRRGPVPTDAPGTQTYGPSAGRLPVGRGPGPYGSGSAEPPVVARGRLAEARRRRHEADQQVERLERFEAKLSTQIHEATEAERHDYARELLSRRLAVRARLEETTVRRGRLRLEEERLGAVLAREEARQPAR